MNCAELRDWLARGGVLRFPEQEYGEVNGRLVVADRVPLPLSAVSASYDPSQDVEVFDYDGAFLGMLCLGASRGDLCHPPTLTDWQYAAYLADIDVNNVGADHVMASNYLVIERGRVADYWTNASNSAPIWGGFVHRDAANIPGHPLRVSVARLDVVHGIHLPTVYHYENAARAHMQPYAFERFLKLFHLLELLLDYDVVKRIQALGEDLEGIGRLLSEYQSDDLTRLKKVIRNRCISTTGIEAMLGRCIYWIPMCRNIFETHGKKGNPLHEGKFDKFATGGSITVGNAKNIGLPTEQIKYRENILDIAAYWIFRVRCCIAHSQIGEYLFVSGDEEFVVQFAEPLLRAVLIEAFKLPVAVPIGVVPVIAGHPPTVPAGIPDVPSDIKKGFWQRTVDLFRGRK